MEYQEEIVEITAEEEFENEEIWESDEEYEGQRLFWKPHEVGDDIYNPSSIIGEVIDVDREGMFGLQITIQTADGQVTTPAHKSLQSKLKSMRVEYGEYIKIEYVGEREAKNGNTFRDYSVHRRL